MKKYIASLLATFLLKLADQKNRHQISSPVDQLDPARNKSISEREESIRGLLRRFPYWSAGHRALGSLQIDKKDKKGAYISALAAIELSGRESVENRHLLARVYLQSRMEREAQQILEELHQRIPNDFRICEDLAAAEMHFEKYARARELLEEIPVAQRSASAAATLGYLVSRQPS